MVAVVVQGGEVSVAHFRTLAAQCAPDVATPTLAAIAKVESGFRPWAIRDNTTKKSYFPADEAAAVRLAAKLLAEGHSVDMGLMQINSQNLSVLDLKVQDIFAPCTNITAGATILAENYSRAIRIYTPGQAALYRALSAYHRGKFDLDRPYLRRILEAALVLSGVQVASD